MSTCFFGYVVVQSNAQIKSKLIFNPKPQSKRYSFVSDYTVHQVALVNVTTCLQMLKAKTGGQ